MNNWLNYLLVNPVLALAIVVILVLFIFMVLRKLIKWAVISFVILALAAGLTYRNSQKPDVVKDVKKKIEEIADKVIRKGKEEAKKAAEKAVDDIKEQIE